MLAKEYNPKQYCSWHAYSPAGELLCSATRLRKASSSTVCGFALGGGFICKIIWYLAPPLKLAIFIVL